LNNFIEPSNDVQGNQYSLLLSLTGRRGEAVKTPRKINEAKI
jgi:hypothetical protein